MRKAGNEMNARMLGRVPPWSRLAQDKLKNLQNGPARQFGWALVGFSVLMLASIVAAVVRGDGVRRGVPSQRLCAAVCPPSRSAAGQSR